MEVTKLERQKLELEKSKMNLVADLEELKNTINVSEEAITKLGMSYPKEGQIIYISTEDTRVETSIDESASSKLNEFLSIFSGFFRRLQI
jgi:poly(3-hydroxyalkanoate) synthetase